MAGGGERDGRYAAGAVVDENELRLGYLVRTYIVRDSILPDHCRGAR